MQTTSPGLANKQIAITGKTCPIPEPTSKTFLDLSSLPETLISGLGPSISLLISKSPFQVRNP